MSPERIAAFVLRHRYAFCALSLGGALALLPAALGLRFEGRIGDFVPQHHPFVEVHRELTRTFGGLNQVAIALEVERGDVFRREVLERVVRITRQLYLMDGINPARVMSLASRQVKRVWVDAEGFRVRRLMREAPRTPQEMRDLRQAVLRDPMIYGRLVSRDLKATLIVADFEEGVPVQRVFRQLRRLVERERAPGLRIWLAGRPVLEGWLEHYLPTIWSSFGIALAIMAGLLWWSFRRRRAVALPLVGAACSTVMGLGGTRLLGHGLGPLTSLAPFLIMAIGVSHSVQILERYFEELEGHVPREAARRALAALFSPMRASLFTDALGFASLLLVPIPSVRAMAVVATLGVASLFLNVLCFLPCALSLLPPRFARARSRRLEALAALLASPLRRRVVIGGFGALAAVSLLGIARLRVGEVGEGSPLLWPHSPYNRAEAAIARRFCGANPGYVLVAGDRPEALVSWRALAAMDDLARRLRALPEVGYVVSLADYVKRLNWAMYGGDPRAFRVPHNDRTIGEYLLLYDMSSHPGDFDPVVSPDLRVANVEFDLRDRRPSTIERALAAIRAWLRDHRLPPGIELRYAGGLVGCLAAVNEIVAHSLLQTSALLLALVYLRISLALSSLSGGALLLVPLLFGGMVTFGTFGWLGIGLTVETLPVVAMGIGLGIDYSIYMAARLAEEVRSGHPDPVRSSLATTGRAVGLTAAVVGLSVCSWLVSPVKLQAKLGAALAAMLGLNVLGSLVLLPWFVVMLRPSFVFKRGGAR